MWHRPTLPGIKEIQKSRYYSADQVHIWGNPEINIQFNSRINNGNIIYATDLYKTNGEKLTQKEIKKRFGTNITFIEYHAIYTGIPRYMKNEL